VGETVHIACIYHLFSWTDVIMHCRDATKFPETQMNLVADSDLGYVFKLLKHGVDVMAIVVGNQCNIGLLDSSLLMEACTSSTDLLQGQYWLT
jgi:hypothetical protein